MIGRPRVADEIPASAPEINPTIIVGTVIRALEDLPNYDEIRDRLVKAFLKMEEAHDDGPANRVDAHPGVAGR